MKKNWYAVYTKPNLEKKVASLLTRKGLINYCAVNSFTQESPIAKRLIKKPLFNSLVFVYIAETETHLLRTIPGIINLVYWQAKPAVINEDEIHALQQFTMAYQNIRLEKEVVMPLEKVKVSDDPSISFKESSATIRFHTLRIKLPSLGYSLIAERERKAEAPAQAPRFETSNFTRQLNFFLSN